MEENVIQINVGKTINVDVNVKKHHVCEKDYVLNTATCKFENGKCLASITDNSVIMFGEIVGSYDKEIKTIATNFNEKKATCKIQNFYILLAFLLITIALFIAASIYCYLIKY